MVWLYLTLGAGILIVVVGYLRARGAPARAAAGAKKRMRDLVTEDVEQLRAELDTLDGATADPHYVQAQRAYESARAALAQSQEIETVAEAVAEGNYEVACVRARRDGRELPEDRVPCFFDPRHGPSTVDVLWTEPGGGRRRLPACTGDAERISAGAEPFVRTVDYDGVQVPYWEADTGAYGRAYFSTDEHALAVFAAEPDPSEGGSHTAG